MKENENHLFLTLSEYWKMLFLCLVGHSLEDHNLMAIFSVKVTLQLGICMHQTVRTHLKILISNLFWSLCWSLLLELLFVNAGICLAHTLHDANLCNWIHSLTLYDLLLKTSTCLQTYVLSILYRQVYGGTGKDQYCENDHICYDEHEDANDCSNFLDVDWLSSSENSCEEELLDRCSSETLFGKLACMLSCCFLPKWEAVPAKTNF